jgi:hypothetical protein
LAKASAGIHLTAPAEADFNRDLQQWLFGLFGDWENDGKNSTLIRRRVKPDAALVIFDNRLDNCQPKSSTGGIVGDITAAVELVEDIWLVRGGNARTIVNQLQDQLTAL